jgi:hypothetical protein
MIAEGTTVSVIAGWYGETGSTIGLARRVRQRRLHLIAPTFGGSD